MKIKLYGMLAAGCLAALLLGGCGALKRGQAGEEQQEQGQLPQENQEEEIDRYLEELEKLSGAAGELAQAGEELAELCDTNPENVEEMEGRVEEMRELKQVFAEFSLMEEVPEIFGEAHEKMAEAAGDYGALIDTYCDVLEASIRGEDHPEREGIRAKWEEQSRAVAQAMEEMQKAAGHFGP